MAETAEPAVLTEEQKLAADIAFLQKEIIQLQAPLGEEHAEVLDRKTKLETLLLKQKENHPPPHAT